jgi:predicted MPP superfamily phosphohydrolase
MAILDDAPGIEAWIEVDGQRAEEYFDPGELEVAPKAICRYIESVPGKGFTIVVKHTPEFSPNWWSRAVQFYVDGVRHSGQIVKLRKLKQGDQRSLAGVRHTLDNGNVTFQAFQFAELNIGKCISSSGT